MWRAARIIALVSIVVLGTVLPGCSGSNGLQVWKLTMDVPMPYGAVEENIYIDVQPSSKGALGSTFDQEDDPIGDNHWYAYDDYGGGANVYVGGQVDGSAWMFVNMAGHDSYLSIVGSGDGQMNTAYPAGTTVSGQCHWDYSFTDEPENNHMEDLTWSGIRVK